MLTATAPFCCAKSILVTTPQNKDRPFEVLHENRVTKKKMAQTYAANFRLIPPLYDRRCQGYHFRLLDRQSLHRSGLLIADHCSR